MIISMRTGLSLLVALLLMAAGSEQLFAQGTGPGAAPEQPPPGSQRMPTNTGDTDNEDRSQFPTGNVKIGGGENKEGKSAAMWASLETLAPYIILIVVVAVGIIVYMIKSSSGKSHDSSEPAAEEPVAQVESPDVEPGGEVQGGFRPADDGSEGGGGDEVSGGDGGV